MEDTGPVALDFRCGAKHSRGKITGKDWRNPALQKRYAGYFSAYIAGKIKTEKRGRKR